jgi:hypothetical protein
MSPRLPQNAADRARQEPEPAPRSAGVWPIRQSRQNDIASRLPRESRTLTKSGPIRFTCSRTGPKRAERSECRCSRSSFLPSSSSKSPKFVVMHNAAFQCVRSATCPKELRRLHHRRIVCVSLMGSMKGTQSGRGPSCCACCAKASHPPGRLCEAPRSTFRLATEGIRVTAVA